MYSPFVVAQVQINLAAIVEDVDLAVLVGGEGAGVDVNVRVDLDAGTLIKLTPALKISTLFGYSPCCGNIAVLEDDPDRAGDDALADAGDDAARHQHVLHGCRIGIPIYTTQSNASIKGPTEQ